jgi:hypothetical protein
MIELLNSSTIAVIEVSLAVTGVTELWNVIVTNLPSLEPIG